MLLPTRVILNCVDWLLSIAFYAVQFIDDGRSTRVLLLMERSIPTVAALLLLLLLCVLSQVVVGTGAAGDGPTVHLAQSRRYLQTDHGRQRNPLVAYRSRNYSLPLCYQSPESRRNMLPGTYVDIGYRMARYWNLSCPLEMSKLSCIHQGANVSRANYAANLHFVPSNCVLLSREDMLPYLALHTNLNIVFFGNSLIRQVMTGLICDMHAMGLLASLPITWISCSENRPYPCHGTMHCIQCGEHSGAEEFTAHLIGGGSLRFVWSHKMDVDLGSDTSRIDLVIGQRWQESVDERFMDNFYDFRLQHSLPVPKLVIFFSYGAHFVNGGELYNEGDHQPSGIYNETYLSEVRRSRGVVPCLRSAGSDPTWYDSNHAVFKKWVPEGYIWLQGTNDLGDAKVGNAVGKFGDCQHFCLPGPTDEIARGLLQYVLTMFTL
jgi:hypothetical protein